MLNKIFILVCLAWLCDAVPNCSDINFPLTCLGKVDGKDKHFYSADKLQMNWADAKKYCESFELKLASIESLSEFQLLRDSLPENKIHYWTSAREKRRASSFVWNTNTTESPNLEIIEYWDHLSNSTPYHYCGAFYPNGSDTRMETVICSTRTDGTLCQSSASHLEYLIFLFASTLLLLAKEF